MNIFIFGKIPYFLQTNLKLSWVYEYMLIKDIHFEARGEEIYHSSRATLKQRVVVARFATGRIVDLGLRNSGIARSLSAQICPSAVRLPRSHIKPIVSCSVVEHTVSYDLPV